MAKLLILVVVIFNLKIMPITGAGSLKEVRRLGSSINTFALDLYKEIVREEPDKNILFSPVSIATALSLLLQGATSLTAQEMRTVLHTRLLRNTPLNEAYQGLNRHLYITNDDVTVQAANKLFVDDSLKVESTFLDESEKYFDILVETLDFANTSDTVDIINNWVSNRTDNKINNILHSGDVSIDTLFALVNAIYFKGKWKQPFNKTETYLADFYTTKDDPVLVQMMKHTGFFKYYPMKDAFRGQLLQMDYLSSDISFLIILPDEDQDIDEFGYKLTKTNLNMFMKRMLVMKRHLFLPKFQIKERYELASLLKKLGMPTLFSGAVNLSGFTRDPRIDVSTVIHQSFLDVNEEGSEAAAASVIIGGKSSDFPTPNFICNRPFIFAIYNNKSGAFLFMGKLMHPSHGDIMNETQSTMPPTKETTMNTTTQPSVDTTPQDSDTKPKEFVLSNSHRIDVDGSSYKMVPAGLQYQFTGNGTEKVPQHIIFDLIKTEN